MGIEEEADRTLFIRNIDSRVSEELLFELFLQAGPLIRIKIPKDPDGKQKTFGFAVYKHEVSPSYGIQLLDGTTLFGRTLHVQHRSGSNHNNTQNTSPANTPNPHGQRTPQQFSSPPYTPPPSSQRSFQSPDSLQKQVMMNNMMWQVQTQQLQQLSDGFNPRSEGGSSRQNHGAPYRPHHGRSQRHEDEAGHRSHGQNRNNYQHPNHRSAGYHRDNRGRYDRDDRDRRW